MDPKAKCINWMGNIYQKFEAVCQEVDNIVGQDAVKYLENQVQNVGDSVKNLYSEVVEELLPSPTFVRPTKHEAYSDALKNHFGSAVVGTDDDNNKSLDGKNIISNFIQELQDSNVINLANDQQQAGAPDSVKSVGSGEYNNKKRDEENPINNFLEALQDSTTTNLTNDQQQAGAPNSVKSLGSGEYNNKNGDEENPINIFLDALQDSTAVNLANDQQVGALDKDELVNQASGEICSDSLEVDDSFTKQGIGGDSRETCVVRKENLHSSIEESSFKSAPELNNLIFAKEKEPLKYVVQSESHFGSLDSTCRVLLATKDNKEVNLEQKSLLIVDENSKNSSAAEVPNFTSLDGREVIKSPLFCESCKRLITKTEPLCFRGYLISDGSYLSSLGSYWFEIESSKSNSGDIALCISDNSVMHESCESAQVPGQVMEFCDGLVASCCCQPMEPNAESTVHSIGSRLEDIQLNDDTKLEESCLEDIKLNDDTKPEESCLENIQLNDDTKPEESCVFVDDTELYAASLRTRKHRSYKKRIQDAFTSNKKLAKEYEQLGIWYGDIDMESSQDLPQTLLPFRSRTSVDLKHLQMQQASETEWELL